jgi:hypothetical protein
MNDVDGRVDNLVVLWADASQRLSSESKRYSDGPITRPHAFIYQNAVKLEDSANESFPR